MTRPVIASLEAQDKASYRLKTSTLEGVGGVRRDFRFGSKADMRANTAALARACLKNAIYEQ